MNKPVGNVPESVYLRHVPDEDEKLPHQCGDMSLKSLSDDDEIVTSDKRLILDNPLLERKIETPSPQTNYSGTLSVKDTHEDKEAPSVHGQVTDKDLTQSVQNVVTNTHSVAYRSASEIQQENIRLLFKACEDADVNEMGRLIKEGVNLNVKNASGQTPLHIMCGNIKNDYGNDFCVIVDGSLDSDGNAKITFDKHYRYSLHKYNEKYYVNRASGDIEKHIDLYHRVNVCCLFLASYDFTEIKDRVNVALKDNQGRTPLHIACEKNNSASVAAILLSGKFNIDADQDHQKNPNVDIKDNAGNTPMHNACNTKTEQENRELVELLVEFGADVNMQNNAGDTPYHIACANRCLKIIKDFKYSSYNIDLKNNNGDTALHVACCTGDYYVVNELLSSGAGTRIRNNNNEMPLLKNFVSEAFCVNINNENDVICFSQILSRVKECGDVADVNKQCKAILKHWREERNSDVTIFRKLYELCISKKGKETLIFYIEKIRDVCDDDSLCNELNELIIDDIVTSSNIP